VTLVRQAGKAERIAETRRDPMKKQILLGMLLLLWTSGSNAEDAPGADANLTEVQLIDEAPNYAAVLVGQWSPSLKLEDVEIGRSGASFGRLTTTQPEREITLQEAVALALANNTTLKVRRLDPIAGRVGVRQARSVFDPVLYGEVSKFRESTPFSTLSVLTSGATGDADRPSKPSKSFNQDIVWSTGVQKTLLSGGLLSLDWTNHRQSTIATAVNLVVPQYVTALDLSLNQPLLRDLGWRYSLLLVDLAQNTEEAAFYQYKAATADIVLAVERAYWQLVLAIENVKVGEQGLDLAHETLRDNEGRFNVGALPRTAVLEAQAELARREAILVRLRNQQRLAADRLRSLINYNPSDSKEIIVVQPADEPKVVPYEIDLQRSLEMAEKNRPELKVARLDVEGKRIQRKVAENQLLPRLDLVGSIGLNGLGGDDTGLGTDDTGNGTGFNFRPNPQILGGYDRSLELLTDGRFYQYAVGARFEIPIGNAAARASYAQARVDTERAWLSLQEVEEGVTLEVKQAVTNMESEIEGLPAVRVARELAEENLRNQQARYEVGLATTKDLLDFQERMLQARAAEVEAMTGYNVALADLQRAEGTLLEERRILMERPELEGAPWWARF
jgi:HAE1 family hydrophobic/amphiphilic exporter-1